jgi:diguanylate cyclase
LTKAGNTVEQQGAGSAGGSLAQTQQTAVLALERIEKLGLKPLPQLYELWFRYFQGDPEIVRAIDNHPGELDEVNCHKIYKRYLSETARDDAVKKISDQVQAAITEIATMLRSVKTATSDYSDNLDTVQDRVLKAETLEDLGTVVSAMVADTRQIVEKQQELQLQLVSSSEQVSELRRSLDNVRKEAMMDGLTGLYNRKAFDKQIRDCLEECEEFDATMVLMMLDIDHFKSFNDAFGHQVGDQVLRLVARTLTDNVKGRDIAARYGGEEFAIILPETTLTSGVKVADQLRRQIEGKEVVNKSSQETLGRITLSVGVAQYKRGESVSEFIERADAALYQAKRNGRNRVETAL